MRRLSSWLWLPAVMLTACGTPEIGRPYRQVELYFPSMDALKKGIATPSFNKVAGDLGNFARGGFDALVGVETR